MEVVYKTLKDLGCENKPVITVFNKMDKEIEMPLPLDNNAYKIVTTSAIEKQNLEELLNSIEDLLKSFKKSKKVIIPYSEGSLINFIHNKCDVISEEHTEDGVIIEAYMDEEADNRTDKYTIE